MMHGRYPKVLEQVVIDSMNDHDSLANTALVTPENLDYLTRLVLSLAHQRETSKQRVMPYTTPFIRYVFRRLKHK